MATERVVIEIQLDDGTVKQGFARVQKEALRTAKNTENQFTRTFRTVKGSIDGVVDQVFRLRTALAGVAAGFAIREIAQEFANFERGLVGIGKTTNIATVELDALGESLQELGKEIAVPTDRLLELGRTAGQFGISAPANILKFVDAIGKLELATDLAGEEGAQALVRILNVTGQGVSDIDRFSSAIVALGNNFETTESQIVPISNEIARATARFGVNAQQVAALGTTLNTLGARAESSGTAIQRVFDEIDKAIGENNANLGIFARTAGQTTDEFARAFRDDAFGAFLSFVEGLQSQGNRASATIRNLGLTSQRLRSVIFPLASNFDRLQEAVALSNREFEENQALNIEAGKAVDTLAGDYTKLANTFQDLVVTVGQVLAPTFRQLAQSTTESLEGLTEFFSQFRGNSQAIADFVSGLKDVIRQTLIFFSILAAPAAFSAIRTGLAASALAFRQFGIAVRATGVAIRSINVTAFPVFIKTINKLPVVLKAARIAVNLFKASLTLGLTLAIDALITKFIELQDEFNGAGNAFKAFGFIIQREISKAFIGLIQSINSLGPKFVGFFGVAAPSAIEFFRRKISAANTGLVNLRKEAAKPIKAPTIEPADRGPAGDGDGDDEPRGISQEEIEKLTSFSELFNNVRKSFEIDADSIEKKSKEFARTVGNNIKSGIGVATANAFAAFGKALATGENALESFLNALLASFGQAAIQLGTQFILQGVAYQFAGLPNGGALIAAGAALATFGGALSALGPSNVGPGGDAAGRGGRTIDDLQPEVDTIDPEDISEDQRVVVNIRGDVLDSDETGIRITEILQDSFNAEGVTVVRGA